MYVLYVTQATNSFKGGRRFGHAPFGTSRFVFDVSALDGAGALKMTCFLKVPRGQYKSAVRPMVSKARWSQPLVQLKSMSSSYVIADSRV
jgi:hypothetical protein